MFLFIFATERERDRGEKMLSYKNNSLAFSDVDVKEGIVSGYFSSFDQEPDSDGDIIILGAFSKTIQENGPLGKRRIKHLLDHNPSQVPAVIKELSEDNKGLAYVSKAGSHTLGQDFVKMVDSGIITEHSFGYRTIKQHKGENGWNYLTELSMWEGTSMLTWGANANTPITGLKSLEDILDHYDRLYKALKNGTYSDETMIQLQERHKQISEFIKTTQPNAEMSETTVPSEKGGDNQKQLAEVFFQNFKTAIGNGRGASS